MKTEVQILRELREEIAALRERVAVLEAGQRQQARFIPIPLPPVAARWPYRPKLHNPNPTETL